LRDCTTVYCWSLGAHLREPFATMAYAYLKIFKLFQSLKWKMGFEIKL
jgi:hypothetical protein